MRTSNCKLLNKPAADCATCVACFPPVFIPVPAHAPAQRIATRCTTAAPLTRCQAVAGAPETVQQVAATPGGSYWSEADVKAFLSGFNSLYEEHVLPITDDMVEGVIPADLSGSYLRNGPGLFEIGGQSVPQPFDGDGMVTCMTFEQGKALFRNKYVRTEAFINEQTAGKMLYQGVFNKSGPEGKLFNNPLELAVKKVANTGVIHWAGRLLALYEADLPYELTPDLQTIGRTHLSPATEEVPILAAHYRVVQQEDGAKRWITFGSETRGLDNKVSFQEYAEDGTLIGSRVTVLKGAAFGFFHDCMVTEGHYVLIENAVRLDVWKMVTRYIPKQCSFAECLVYNPSQPCKVHLIPRVERAGSPQVFELPNSFFAFHHFNAFELDGKVVMDTVALLDGIDFSANMDTVGSEYYNGNSIGRGTALRVLLDTRTGKVQQQKLFTRSCEFPAVHPSAVGRQHHVAFCTCDDVDSPQHWAPPQSLAKATLPSGSAVLGSVQLDVYNPGTHRFAQEPMVVPRSGSDGSSAAAGPLTAERESECWVLSYVYDSVKRTTDLVILDGQRLAAGPVATIHLPFTVPYPLHGSWSKEIVGPRPAQVSTAAVYDIRQGVADSSGKPVYQ